jgi:hypothetical protein
VHTDARRSAIGGHSHHRRDLPLVAVHAAWRDETQHMEGRIATARGCDCLDQDRVGRNSPVSMARSMRVKSW